MKIVNLTEDSKIYTSNVFLVLGDWNTIEDKNTLIDVGSDPFIIEKIENYHTGLGKNKIDQVIITHSHSDHSAILPQIRQLFNPVVYGFNNHLKGLDVVLRDGDFIKIADQEFEVYHITSHSYDSICLYCQATGDLFAGDTYFPIEFENQELKDENNYPLARLVTKTVKRIYYGHGQMVEYNGKKFKLLK